MRAALKRLHSPDVDDLEHYMPMDPAEFGFLVQMMVGPEDDRSEESFDFVVCSPKWLQHRLREEPLMGRHYLFIREYNYHRLVDFLRAYCRNCVAATWPEVASKLGRLGKWEFEDYSEGDPGPVNQQYTE